MSVTILHNLLASPVLAALAQHGEAAAHAPEAHATTAGLGAMRHAPSYFLLIALLPFLTFVLSGLCAAFRVKSKLPAWLTVASLAGSFLLTLKLFLTYFTGTDAPARGARVRLDHRRSLRSRTRAGEGVRRQLRVLHRFADALWMLFVTGLATLIALYASEYMSQDLGAAGTAASSPRSTCSCSAMACLVMGGQPLLLYLGWEGVGLCSYLLIGYFYKKPSRGGRGEEGVHHEPHRRPGVPGAGRCSPSSCTFGTVEYAKLFAMIAPGGHGVVRGRTTSRRSWVVTCVIPLLLMLGAFGKSAQLPLYVWLPDAMEGPTPVSALIHAATMVTAGVFLIARIPAVPARRVAHAADRRVAWAA